LENEMSELLAIDFLPVTAAFVATFIFMIALRPLAIQCGIVDRPGGRKTHRGDVPVVGGLAMFAGLYVATSLIPGLTVPFSNLALCCGILALIGILDDCFEIPPMVRFVAQFLVVLIMSYGDGLMIWDIGNIFGLGTVSFGSFSWVFTMLVAVAVINAFNLVDGADGLAGTLALIPLTCIAVLAGPGTTAGVLALVAVAVIAGFLVFNFPMDVNKNVRSFMGDGGSTMVGLLIAWITVSVSQGEGRIVTPVIGLWFAAVPIYDLFTQFTRRLLKGKSPFSPDQEHFHHILRDKGLGVRVTLAVLTGLQAVYAVIGLVAHYAGVADVWMFGAWALIGIGQRALIYGIAEVLAAIQRRRGRGQSVKVPVAGGADHPR
jgi:UDP-GlcNAc:undecaprenyl-phosphate GlcNAc-1-phosphate transferase